MGLGPFRFAVRGVDIGNHRRVTQLEEGRVPWVQPWGNAGGTGPGLPRNALTARPYEARRHRDQPVEVETLPACPLEQLRDTNAATWIDRELASNAPLPIRDAGFGCDVRGAMGARRQWLVDQQLADVDAGRIRLRANAIMMLQRRELLRAGEELTGQLGKPFVEARIGDTIEGRLARKLELVSGRYAFVEKAKEFTLVPWRAALEKQLGQTVSGIMRAEGMGWRFGRGRAGPEVA